MKKTERLLVVDDDCFMRHLFEMMLEDHYPLLLAGSGSDALSMAAAESPDLVILDIELDDMSGFEVCRQIRQMECCHDVPVIFISGHDDIENRLRGEQMGGDDYIIKPIDREVLLARIAGCLGRPRVGATSATG